MMFLNKAVAFDGVTEQAQKFRTAADTASEPPYQPFDEEKEDG
jgi:hypothetical protein